MIVHFFTVSSISFRRARRSGSLWAGIAALSASSVGCGSASVEPRSARPVAPDVTTAGESIYFGSVYPLEGGSAQPAFVYERRVEQRAAGLIATHITRAPSGQIALADSAAHAPDYALYDYTLHTNQMGQSGSIHVRGDEVTFLLLDAGRERSAQEQVDSPVAVGPTLVGYIVRRLDALRAGEVVPVRLAVLDRLETIGFELSATPAESGQTGIRMVPSSFLIGLVVDPILFTFDNSTSNLLRLEGRVPPKLFDGERWQDLDARVEYRYLAAAYR